MNKLGIALVLLLSMQAVSHAAFVTFTSRAEWESEVRGTIALETFDGFGGVSFNDTPLVTPNFTIEAFTDSANNRIENTSGPDSPQMSAFLDFDGNPVRLPFGTALNAWGADMRVSGGTFISVRSGGAEIAAFEPNSSSSAGPVRFSVSLPRVGRCSMKLIFAESVVVPRRRSIALPWWPFPSRHRFSRRSQ